MWDWALGRVAEPEEWRITMQTPPPTPVGAVRREPTPAERQVEADSFADFFSAYQKGVG